MTETLMYKQTIKKAYKIKQKIQENEQNLVVIQRRLAEHKEMVRLQTKKLKEKLQIKEDNDRIATVNSTIRILQKQLIDTIEL